MVNQEFYEKIAKIFCGDDLALYNYKSGPDLVHFFNNEFKSSDNYGQGFPTRWRYVNQKLLELSLTGKINQFLNIILSKKYILTERQISEIDALEHQGRILDELNKVCSVYSLKIVQKEGAFKLVEIDLDLIEIGEGGFANIYLQKSTGRVVKKLNDECARRESLRSRFKREYEITNSCSDIDGIIKVYDFDIGNYSYTMEKADWTLDGYIKESSLTEESQIDIIRQILFSMSQVHQRGLLHRDLSPTNIFLIDGIIKLADFGLGKNLNMLTSHQTMDTASFGQLFYCSPEQLTLLKDADKRSDVYSLGRILNFVMTKNPNDFSHSFRSISEKAANLNPDYRFEDASSMLERLNRLVDIRCDENYERMIWEKISNRKFDSDVENYIYELSGIDLCQKCIQKGYIFLDAIFEFLKIDSKHASDIVQLIGSNYKAQLKKFEDADTFATLAYRILKGNFNYPVMEVAATILRYTAFEVNRFYAQDRIDELKEKGLDPLIEELLER